ncbi:serine hydrolase domain-containing protein [Streptomyces sp. NPDC055709]
MLEKLIGEGRETGLQVAAYLNGQLVVDAWAGMADPATGREVDGDTLFHLFSCGKGVTGTAVHLLVDRGVLEYDTPIASYWPQFGVRGKERITLRHVLTHTAGVPHLPADITVADLCDWDRMCEFVAGLEPLWEPGARSGYHSITYGWLLGEVVRRADGRPIGQLVSDEIVGPLGIADSFALGITDAMLPRMAVHQDEMAAIGPAPSSTLLTAGQWATVANNADYLRACVPGAGTGSARALARTYAALANGGQQDGVRLMSEGRVATASALAVDGVDATLGNPVRRGLGFVLGRPGSPMGHAGAFGHHGWGESIGFADPQHRFAFALAKNNLTNNWSESSTPNTVIGEVRAALGLPAAAITA